MPDLGPYAADVLTAYAVSLVLLAALVVLTVLRARRVARALEEAETRKNA